MKLNERIINSAIERLRTNDKLNNFSKIQVSTNEQNIIVKFPYDRDAYRGDDYIYCFSDNLIKIRFILRECGLLTNIPYLYDYGSGITCIDYDINTNDDKYFNFVFNFQNIEKWENNVLFDTLQQ